MVRSIGNDTTCHDTIHYYLLQHLKSFEIVPCLEVYYCVQINNHRRVEEACCLISIIFFAAPITFEKACPLALEV